MSSFLSIDKNLNSQLVERPLDGEAVTLRFYVELFIERSIDDVWSLFCDVRKWNRWSPICKQCHLRKGRQLGPGSVLEMKLGIAGIVFPVTARVNEFDSHEKISWRGEKFGIQATHTYNFIPRGAGTLLCNEETFSGVRFPLDAFLRAWYRTTGLSKSSLEGIRRALSDKTRRSASSEKRVFGS